jgi:hypothetical protein
VLNIEFDRLVITLRTARLEPVLLEVVGDVLRSLAVSFRSGQTAFEPVVSQVSDVCKPLVTRVRGCVLSAASPSARSADQDDCENSKGQAALAGRLNQTAANEPHATPL